MADEQTRDDAGEQPAPLTQEERLRALTSDRKRKVRGGKTGSGPSTTRPGDLVDAVRERSGMDRGKDQPLQ
jgi:hypothetical protein